MQVQRSGRARRTFGQFQDFGRVHKSFVNLRRGAGLISSDITPKERAMKLSAARIERTLSQIDAQAIPENHPVMAQLNSLFGEHTFFLDSNGLNIVEPAEPTSAENLSGEVINLASWSEMNPTSLEPHEPEPTDVTVTLGPDRPETTH
jgi:hypothetical protein